jgi:acyl-CoA synthetase (AMP-forming)/AMP-acid ligase II
VPDERYGEVVAAFIITKAHQEDEAATGNEIREFVRDNLSSHLGMSFLSFPMFWSLLGWGC